MGLGFTKSASAPPHGGAQEPGSYYSCSVWIVLIGYQSKRRDVYTAAQRHGSSVKFFRWGVSPSKSLNTATTSLMYTFGSFKSCRS